MSDYVEHLVDQPFPSCPKCQAYNIRQDVLVPDETVVAFTCPRCQTEYRAKAEVVTVWSTFQLSETLS